MNLRIGLSAAVGIQNRFRKRFRFRVHTPAPASIGVKFGVKGNFDFLRQVSLRLLYNVRSLRGEISRNLRP